MNYEEWSKEPASESQADLNALTPEEQDQILDKVDEIVDSRGVDPAYVEPFQDSPYRNLRIGEFQLPVAFR